MFRIFASLFLISCYAKPICTHWMSEETIKELADQIDTPFERWRRGTTGFRWEMEEVNAETRQQVITWAKEHHLFAQWKPALPHYDCAVILGATTPSMELRLRYLASLWESGTRFDKVVFLVGRRPLDGRIDRYLDCCNLESDTPALIWKAVNLPQEMRQLSVEVYTAPITDDHVPSTRDNILSWSTTHPGTTLFVSQQPHCLYQYAVINATIASSIDFDVVGPGIVNPACVPRIGANVLDMLAIYLARRDGEQA